MVGLQDAYEAGPNVNGVTGPNSGTNISSTFWQPIICQSIYVPHLNSLCHQLFPWSLSFGMWVERQLPSHPKLSNWKKWSLFWLFRVYQGNTAQLYGDYKINYVLKGYFSWLNLSLVFFAKRDVGRLVFAQAIFAWSWLFQDWQDWVRSPMLGCFLVGRNDDLLYVWSGVRSSRWRSYIDWRSYMYIWTFMDIGWLDY